jgi:Amt family ammonium transporter
MTFKRPYSAGLAAFAVGLFAATAAYAEPTVNKGDNAWMLTSTVLVLLMTIPGLALFYGGLVRSKNMLSVLMQVFYSGRCTATASPSPAARTSSAASRRPS